MCHTLQSSRGATQGYFIKFSLAFNTNLLNIYFILYYIYFMSYIYFLDLIFLYILLLYLYLFTFIHHLVTHFLFLHLSLTLSYFLPLSLSVTLLGTPESNGTKSAHKKWKRNPTHDFTEFCNSFLYLYRFIYYTFITDTKIMRKQSGNFVKVL